MSKGSLATGFREASRVLGVLPERNHKGFFNRPAEEPALLCEQLFKPSLLLHTLREVTTPSGTAQSFSARVLVLRDAGNKSPVRGATTL